MGVDALPSDEGPASRGGADAVPRGAVRALVTGLFGLLLLALVAGPLLSLAFDPRGELYEYSPLTAVTFILAGVLMVLRQPRNPVGWLITAIGASSALDAASLIFDDRPIMLWVSEWLFILRYGLLPLVLLVFPNGRLTSRRWRLVAWAAVVGLAAAAGGFALDAWIVASLPVDAQTPLSRVAWIALRIGRAGVLVSLASTVAAVVSLVVRWRRADGDTRQQLKVLAAAAAVLPVGLVLEIVGVPVGALIAATVLPAAAAVAILKYRLYDIDLFLNRSLVWATLTLVVVGSYAAIVTTLGAVPVVDRGRGPELVATGLIAVVFQPLRDRLQRGANRLLYGDRDDPYAVISRLGRRLEQAVDPTAVLPQVAQTVAEALQLPYVAIEVADAEGARLVAAHGRRMAAPEAFAMTYQGQVVGRLLAAPRALSEPFTAAECDLLEDLARQAGLAAHAVRLTADLQRSRERLVRSREEERRRLRRDLHDGLGPALAGMTMQVGAARALLSADGAQTSPAADEVLGTLERQLQTCVGEIRRLVDDLRPPALDQLGLVAAIRRRAGDFSVAGDRSACTVVVSAPDDLGELPAAVEIATYRIATEAVTNTIRHAAASRCLVRLTMGEGLTVEVVDDGVGLPDDCQPGVGLASMRERADELGGTLLIQRLAEGGTRVHAELPLSPPNGD